VSEKRYSPFSTCSQYGDWAASNCWRCTKDAPIGVVPTCPIQIAVDNACFDDGTVSEDIAQRMGFLENEGHYVWPCVEVEWTEEWKAEFEAMKAEAAA
jgi:hypothetical protein